jgi:hypothetical protein
LEHKTVCKSFGAIREQKASALAALHGDKERVAALLAAGAKVVNFLNSLNSKP